MKLEQIILEANVAAKLKDPKTIKRLTIAMRHDHTLPKSAVARLGPKPDEAAVVQLWSDLLDSSLSSTDYGDLSQDGKFDEWLTRLYINGQVDYEDVHGEGGDALGAWKALSIRGRLKERDQDFNKFRSLKQIQDVVRQRDYRDELERIKDSEKIEQMKRNAKQVEIYDDERFSVVVPLNFGACYSRDKAGGYIPNFCTSSSSGERWFRNYAPDGIIVNVIDKQNIDDVDGKWQFHAATNQIVRGDQDRRSERDYNDRRFAELFPGLMKKIAAGLKSHAEEIKNGSKELTSGGYDIAKEVELLKIKYPVSFASKAGDEPEDEPDSQAHEPAAPEAPAEPQAEPQQAQPEAPAEPQAEPQQQERMFRVTQLASGRTANISGRDLAHVQERVLQRYPDSTIDDYTWEEV